MGWGLSDKPAGYRYTAARQTAEVDAVVNYFRLEDVVLVAHDASGPPAIDWSLDHPERVAQLLLLNTYYSWMPTLHRPDDPYLNRGVARRFHRLLPTSDLFLLPTARHYIQVDEPQMVAALITSATGVLRNNTPRTQMSPVSPRRAPRPAARRMRAARAHSWPLLPR